MTIRFEAKVESGFLTHSPLQPFVFPDGAVHIKGADDPGHYKYQIAYATGLSHDELFTLSMWADAVDDREERSVLILPYLPGARMDRGLPNGARVYADFIANMVRPDRLITIDPHSAEWLRQYDWFADNNTTVFPVERIIRNEVQDPTSDSKSNNTYQGVIAPDKGAHERAADAARVMGNLPVYTAGKTRDFETGKLTGLHMEDELPDEGRFLIVDDICDGGGTFVGLAEAIGVGRERLDLWVTHGIFSKGIGPLLDHFGVIHTTDSYFLSGGGDYLTASHARSGVRLKVHNLDKYLYHEIGS